MRGKEDEVKRAKKEVMERWKERTLEEIEAEAKEKLETREREIVQEANEKKEELRRALEGFEGSWAEGSGKGQERKGRRGSVKGEDCARTFWVEGGACM